MPVLFFIENVRDSSPSQKPDNGAYFSVDVQQTEPSLPVLYPSLSLTQKKKCARVMLCSLG